MKLTRIVLACTLLLLASFPVFALPQCKECVNNVCMVVPGTFEYCKYVNGVCTFSTDRCSVSRAEPVLTDWTVASIEISRPALDSEIVTTSADAAEDCPPVPATAEEK
jgi:hypothetical protein